MTDPSHPEPAQAEWFAERASRLEANIGQVLRGKADVIRLALVALLSEGHLLVEDVPGVGKTTLARAIATSVDATWHRIQFTPDLLPSDITGVSIWDQERRAFEFRPGPVFANVVVADEINRASPKTQSALLEVMEERQVSVEGTARPVPRPFLVVATQNPIDLDGTYRLPEAQLDRFLLRVSVGYPSVEEEAAILDQRAATGQPAIRPVLGIEDLRTMIDLAARVHVAPAVSQYVVAIASASRQVPDVRLGASPRASLALLRAAQAHALLDGRSYVVPHDVKALAGPVLAHRLVLAAEAEVEGRRSDEVLAGIVASVPTPSGR
ncbi:MoxR family ATPase [Aquihabitans sp. G128]|uniref:AAA family ATPase n=1 Tax=Aquihabitans sp. G128 TaxID=2849779 RepID=UPI001C21CA49|nr:MoxR family ATPase [Aquihabitans sp. G128]QXC61379.1 MoxR family ATPase [Aquihabitans sp. G128]